MRTGPTNPILVNLIEDLKQKSEEQNVNIWGRVAEDLTKPSRERRIVNLSNININTKNNEIIVVPGKVLGTGDLDHKITIAAFQFSGSALEKIKKSGSKILSITELAKESPKGRKIRIIG